MLSSRLRLVGTMALWLTSCGRAGYDSVGAFDGDSGISPTIDGSDEPSLLQATCSTDGTTALTLPAEVSIAAGSAILVRVQARTSSEAPSSVSDTQGNTYVQDFTAVEAGLSKARVDLYSAQIDTALQPGDTITVNHADVRSNGVAVTLLPSKLPSNIAPTAVSSAVVVADSDLLGLAVYGER